VFVEGCLDLGDCCGGAPELVLRARVVPVGSTPVLVPVTIEDRSQVCSGHGVLDPELVAQLTWFWFDNRRGTAGAERVDHAVVEAAGGRPEPHDSPVTVGPWRPGGRAIAPPQRSLAEAKLVADPLCGRVDGEPGQLVRWEIDHQHDRTMLDLVDRVEQCAGDPQLRERPSDLGPDEPQSVARDIGELDEMPNGRRPLHVISLTELDSTRRQT
jgi:hypothetical protein